MSASILALLVEYPAFSPLQDVDPGTLTYETDWSAIDDAIDAESQS